MTRPLLIFIMMLFMAGSAFASGYGVFTQGASALGQANSVVAHPTGPSSVYFNPALLNDVPGQQVEFGTTAVYADRSVSLASGEGVEALEKWEFPSNFYYTQQINDGLTAGLGVFFPFGLSSEWPAGYEGRYLATSGEFLTANINPAISYRVSDRLSVAAGVSTLYLKATLKKKINQTAAYTLTDLALSGGAGGALPALAGPLDDIDQSFDGDGWGYGYNVGVLYRVSELVRIGLSYRSHVDVEVEGNASFRGVQPLLATAFPDTAGQGDIRLPAQATAGIAFSPTSRLVIEAGVRWEDWSSTDELRVELATPVFSQSTDITPRDWNATWSYNIGGHYKINDALALNAGYLYGQNAVPDATFEPLVPDADAHLFTVGTEWTQGSWTIATAFGFEHHESRRKNNALGDPLGGLLAASPVSTANGLYDSDLFLVGLSVGYRF